MPHPCPHHCPKPGGGGAAVLVVLAVVIAAAAARTVVHAAEQLLEIALIAAGSILGLGAIGAVAYVVLRAHRRQITNLRAMSQHAAVVQRASQAVSAPQRRAIEAPRPSLADLQDLAARHGYDLTRRED